MTVKFVQLLAPAGVDDGNGSGDVHEGWELSKHLNTRCPACRE